MTPILTDYISGPLFTNTDSIRGNNMRFMLVEYRTLGSKYSSFAAIPHIFYPDFETFFLSDGAVVVRTTIDYRDRIDRLSTLSAPTAWPSYRACERYVILSDTYKNSFIGR